MLIMIRAANVLNRLVRTRHKIEGNPDRMQAAAENIRRLLSDIMPNLDSSPLNDSRK